MSVVVVAIVAECLSEAVTIVEHGCHSVEAESVEVEFVKPVFAVAQQEVYHFILAVVEAQTVPCRVLSAVAGIEVLAGISGEVAETFYLVLHSMAVYDVHYHGNSHFVCRIDE